MEKRRRKTKKAKNRKTGKKLKRTRVKERKEN